MDKDHNGAVTLDEFVHVFMEAEAVLKEKIERAENYLADFKKQRQEAVQKLEQLKKDEQLNQHGIMVGSILTITIMGVQELTLSSTKEVYVKVTCSESNFQSEFVRYTGQAAFNEVFTTYVFIYHPL